MDQAHDGDVAALQNAIDVGQRVLAAVGVRAGGTRRVWHNPSRTATRPPSEPTFEEASVTRVVGRAQRGSGQVEHQVVRADGDDRAVDLPTPRSRSTSTSSPGWWPSRPAGTTSRPVGTHERREHAGARGSGVATSRRHAPEAHAHPVVHAQGRGELARQPRADARAFARRSALQGRQQRAAKISKVRAAETG
jgi:hypothetical protein